MIYVSPSAASRIRMAPSQTPVTISPRTRRFNRPLTLVSWNETFNRRNVPDADGTRPPLPSPHHADANDVLPSRFRITPDIRAEAADRRRMERELATATREGRLALHYQPRLMLEGGRPLGAEALIRWPHRKRGLLPQGMFLSVAERSGQVVEIGAWAIAAACRDAATWPDRSVVSVNIAAPHIASPDLLRHVAAALEASGLPPDRLELGLSETVLQDVGGDTFLALAAVRDLGAGLSVDDFGASVGSLTMLRRLPLTMLRLDRSLIRELPHDAEAVAIVRAVIEAGHALGLGVGATGIEDERQRALLAECGCDEGQGPLFGVPLDAPRIAFRLIN
jgi:EAL domain-containing protein (putative c-di-GMP-specific phosphodiesterase class I)